MRPSIMLIAFLAMIVGGCATPPPWPNPEAAIPDATGVGVAIAVRSEPGPVDAEEPLAGSLSLATAMTEALRHDAGLAAALAEVRMAQADAHQARLLPNPVLTVVLRWPESGGSPTLEAGVAAELLSLLRKPGEIDAADHRLRAATARVLTVAIDLIAQVQRQYVAAQSLEAALPMLRARADLMDRLVTLARRRLDAGEGTRLDVTALETERVGLEVEIGERLAELRDVRVRLLRQMGRPTDDPALVADVHAFSPPQPTGDEASWIAAALTHRPEIQAAVWEAEALGVDARLTRWALLEPLEAGVDVEHDPGEWSAGPAATVPLPLFDWGQAKRQRAEAEVSRAMHRLVDLRRDVIEQVRRAHGTCTQLAALRATLGDRMIPLLERRVDDTRQAFEGGAADVTAVLVAEHELRAGQMRLVELDRRVAESVIELHRAVGGSGRAPVTEAAIPTHIHDAPEQVNP